MKEAVFPLREGYAVLQLPERLSKASLDTLKKWMELVLLQINVEDDPISGRSQERNLPASGTSAAMLASMRAEAEQNEPR